MIIKQRPFSRDFLLKRAELSQWTEFLSKKVFSRFIVYFQCDKIVQFCVSKHILWVACICCPMASVDIDSNLSLMTYLSNS